MKMKMDLEIEQITNDFIDKLSLFGRAIDDSNEESKIEELYNNYRMQLGVQVRLICNFIYNRCQTEGSLFSEKLQHFTEITQNLLRLIVEQRISMWVLSGDKQRLGSASMIQDIFNEVQLHVLRKFRSCTFSLIGSVIVIED